MCIRDRHALLLNKVKLFLNQLGKARNCLVQILVPDIVEAHYALSYLLEMCIRDRAINTLDRIDGISRALNPYSQNQAFMALAEQPEMRFIISNTTEERCIRDSHKADNKQKGEALSQAPRL